MIIDMERVRLIGPKAALRPTLVALQDLALLHLVEPAAIEGLEPRRLTAIERRRVRHVERALADVETACVELERLGAEIPDSGEPIGEAAIAVRARRLRSRIESLVARRRALIEEREALESYRPLFSELEGLLSPDRGERRFSAYLLRVRQGTGDDDALAGALDELLASEHELRARDLEGGDTALLLVVPAARAAEVDRLLADARVEAAPVPAAFADLDLVDALPRMRPRLARVEVELAEIADQASEIAAGHGGALAAARRCFHDELIEVDARSRARETARAFVLEGWVPARRLSDLAAGVAAAVGDTVSVTAISRDRWSGEQAPVVLSNPRWLEPFERITSMLPLPRYGSVDPTPFVAVFFPMLFGVIVGDVGYGLVIAGIALLLRRGAPRGGLRRDLSRIAAAIAAFTIIFGALYGELFGDLGGRLFGMAPLWFDREEAVIPFLVVAVSLGVGHLIIGLVLGALSRWRDDRRVAIGRGLAASMLALIVVALLALFEHLPRALLSPAIVALLIAFPLIIAVERLTGVLELVKLFGHVLSYARIMALGTASVMLAVVANRMVGAFGSAAIGIAFALLFHLVNFAIALFSPTIHLLRLHYVEFFGTFYSPGGDRYRPLARWSPARALSN